MELIEERHELSTALEDYLETIFELVRDQKFARVKDIAKARGVRSASVSPAMKRLA
jgi:DtxR family Mn-dependent transcriptional regulator